MSEIAFDIELITPNSFSFSRKASDTQDDWRIILAVVRRGIIQRRIKYRRGQLTFHLKDCLSKTIFGDGALPVDV